MKKGKIIIILGIMIVSIAAFACSTSAFSGYYSIGYGYGGEAKAHNITLEIGSQHIKIQGKPYLAGISIPVINHGDDKIPADIIDSPPSPYSDYTSLGEKAEGFEVGLLGRLGKEILAPSVYLSLLGGITRSHEIHVTQSNQTDKYYEQSSGSKIHGVLGLGVGYFPELFDWKTRLNIQIDYDNRRGMTGYLGWGW